MASFPEWWTWELSFVGHAECALSLEARLLVMLGTSGLAPALGLAYSYGL